MVRERMVGKKPVTVWQAAALAVMVWILVPGIADAGKETPHTASGLPVPRFVSLKSDNVTVRAGPTKDQDVAWIFTRPGLPVEITAEFENWRRVRDSDGSEGWVYHSLLSGRRTAVVTTKAEDGLAPLYDRADVTGSIAAKLQTGVVANVKRCGSGWCRVVGKGFDGYIQQERLWGVYQDEKVE